jgi:ankyrin repeat protein
MKTATFGVLLALLLAAPNGSLWAQAGGGDKALADGVRLVEEGDFEGGIPTLEGVVKRVAADKSRSKDLSRAYLYLAIAYLGLSQEASAKAKFIDAIANDPQLKLSPKEFPPKIIQSFEEARRASARTAPPMITKQVPYFEAVKRGDFATVRDLLKEEPGLVAEKDAGFGATGLHWASLKGHEAVVGLLLAQGADPSIVNGAGETPFQVATRAGFAKVADLLRVPEDAVYDAAKANDLGRVRQMIEANPALLNRKDPQFGATPLHFAALRGSQDVVEYLVGKGADQTIRNRNGETAMQVADRAGRKNVVALLSGAAAPVSAAESPIFDAAKRGDLGTVRQLVQSDPAELKKKDAAFGATPLHWAALRGHKDVVTFLLSAGADTKATNRDGETPLQVARRAGKNDVVEVLTKGSSQ